MRKLIKAGRVIEDRWQPVDADMANPGRQQILSLDQWLRLIDKSGRAVMLEPGQAPAPLFDHLERIPLIASIGSIPDAFHAGYIPEQIPTNIAENKLSAAVPGSKNAIVPAGA